MDYLVIGDPHGSLPAINSDHDGIITTGDYGFTDDQRTAFATARTSDSQRRAAHQGLASGRSVLETLDQEDGPVYTVEGNWDFAYDELTADLDSIQQTEGTAATDEGAIVGYPAEEFVTEPEIPYDQFGVDADTFQDAFFSYRDGDSSLEELAADLAVGDQLLAEFIDEYEDDYSDVADQLEEADSPTVLLSHSPPFNTDLDQIEDPSNPKHGKHYGSVLIRELIEDHQPAAAVSGHIHEGEGIDTVGETTCLNAGLGGVYSLTVADKSIEVQPTDHADR